MKIKTKNYCEIDAYYVKHCKLFSPDTSHSDYTGFLYLFFICLLYNLRLVLHFDLQEILKIFLSLRQLNSTKLDAPVIFWNIWLPSLCNSQRIYFHLFLFFKFMQKTCFSFFFFFWTISHKVFFHRFLDNFRCVCNSLLRKLVWPFYSVFQLLIKFKISA